jgi:regulator of sigma E protease
VSWAVAVLGLALLVLIHEAGHFFVARTLGMRPRKFYLGFPPAIAKTERGGIEYGIGAIPLGGYVKIPGMHRPAPSDLDTHLGTALHEAPELTGSVERMKRKLDRGEFE